MFLLFFFIFFLQVARQFLALEFRLENLVLISIKGPSKRCLTSTSKTTIIYYTFDMRFIHLLHTLHQDVSFSFAKVVPKVSYMCSIIKQSRLTERCSLYEALDWKGRENLKNIKILCIIQFGRKHYDL